MAQLTSTALEDLEAVKSYLKISSSDQDEKIIELINTVSADCEAHCRRGFIEQTYTDEAYDGDGSNCILLRNYPVTDVASLTLDTHTGSGIAQTEGIQQDFVYYADGRIVLLKRNTVEFPQNIKVTYTAGYTNIAALPGDLRMSIRMAVAFKWKEQDKKILGVDSMNFQEQSVSLRDQVYPKHVLVIWNRQRRKIFGGE